MSYSVTTAISELQAMLHGTNTNQIENIYGVFNRAARKLLLDIDPQETIRIAQLSQQIFYGVWKYACPTDLKGVSIIDVRPQGKRYPYDRYLQGYSQDFDLNKSWTNYPAQSFEFDDGGKSILLVNPTFPSPIVINNNDSVSGNGTWVAGTGVSNIAQNTILNYNGSPVVGFDVSTATTCNLYNWSFSAVDLTANQGKSTLFLPIYLPTGSNYTSFTFQWGKRTGSSAYWYNTQTTQYDGSSFQNGWNILGFPWTASTPKAGLPDYASVNLEYLSISKSATAENGLAIGTLTCQLGTILETVYYSKYMFRNATTGVWQETVLTNDDLINLDTESYNLWLFLCAGYSVQQALGEDAGYDTNYFLDQYDEAKAKYLKRYPSQMQKPKTTYYKLPDNRYEKYTGWFYR